MFSVRNVSRSSLHATENRLVRIFIIGFFLFLITFEVIFLFSRMYLEEMNQKEAFLNNSSRVLDMLSHNGGDFPENQRRGSIGYIIVNSSGEIITNRLAGQDTTSITEIFDKNLFDTLSTHDIMDYEKLLLRKVMLSPETGNSILFVTTKVYDQESLLRDVIRFFLMDLMILIPVFFIARTYIRESLEPVRENIDTMNHFVHDAGHELKTPLAIISGNLQLLRESKKIEKNLIIECISVIDGMNNSIEGLLELADLKRSKTPKRVSLKNISDEILQQITSNYRSITVHNNIPTALTWNMDEKHLSIILRNLIENALKYNVADGSVTISATKNTITVSDTGIGIAPNEQDRIFDRFYRANASNTQSGSGIGLTLVDKIVKLYDGNIKLKSTIGEGTTIKIQFKNGQL